MLVIVATGLMMADQPGDVVILINFSSIFFLAMISVGVTMATGNFKTYIMGVNALLSKKYHISAADKERAIRYFKMMSRTVMYASGMATIMMILFILLTLDDPSTLGPKIALSLSAVFYGFLINGVFTYPAVHILESRYNQEEKRVVSEKQVMDKLLELCYKQGISPEEIMDAREIYFNKP
jgi:flagellar motor component MotA